MGEWLHGLTMTFREKEIYQAMGKLKGEAHPKFIAEEMGISRDYAETLCREMVLRKHFVKKGQKYALKK